ncbi:M20 metallopeptidase family protein [Nocardioides montaniterrae]
MTSSLDHHARTAALGELREALEAELPAAVELRHTIHADPEPSGEEWRTAERVAAAIGAGDGQPVAGTGRLIRIGRQDGPCVGVRAELDALPGPDGFMHACGHDVHLAALTALARAAARVEDLPLPLLAILQPREEHPPSGARDIVATEEFQHHDPCAVVGAHVQPLLDAGCVAATPGAVNAAADHVEITVSGQGGHGGYPHLTRDPVAAMAQVIVALQELVSRRMDPLHATVLTIGSVHAGSTHNVIPDVARAEATLRVLEEEDRQRAHDELRSIVEHVAAGLGCTGKVVVHEGEPVLVNEPLLTMATHPRLVGLGFDVASSLRSCGADDFSYYGGVAQSLMMFVGLPDDGSGLHQPGFAPPDRTVGDVALAMLAGYLGAVDAASGGE